MTAWNDKDNLLTLEVHFYVIIFKIHYSTECHINSFAFVTQFFLFVLIFMEHTSKTILDIDDIWSLIRWWNPHNQKSVFSIFLHGSNSFWTLFIYIACSGIFLKIITLYVKISNILIYHFDILPTEQYRIYLLHLLANISVCKIIYRA